MRRGDLEHIIRAAAAVSGDSEIVVVGSQAILAQFPSAPQALLFSQEADVYPRNDPASAIAIDGALGDGSQFHETFGYYAHGVGPETAIAPEGWQDRLVPIHVDRYPVRAGKATGWCLEAHDLVLSKCLANRERDWQFAAETVRQGIVDPAQLLDRVLRLPVAAERRERLKTLLESVIAQAGNADGSARQVS
jgi:hypothetical protein